MDIIPIERKIRMNGFAVIDNVIPSEIALGFSNGLPDILNCELP